jgi:hypothetical protein
VILPGLGAKPGFQSVWKTVQRCNSGESVATTRLRTGSGALLPAISTERGARIFVLLQPRDGGRRQRFAVDLAGKLLEPPLEEP